ncbi:MAG: toll/interleukin-1 receptor domain-containing protein [Pseudomonadota bacterium]
MFISYAWESDAFRDWVKQLATQLRADGIDARLDAWHLEDGITFVEFMNREVRQADRVLVLCSPEYRRNVEATEEGENVHGAGWESMLLSSALVTTGREKVVPALAKGTWENAAPFHLSALPYVDLTALGESDGSRAYHALVRRLIGQTERVPALGQMPEQADESPVPPLFGGAMDQVDTSASIPVVDSSQRRGFTAKRVGLTLAILVLPAAAWFYPQDSLVQVLSVRAGQFRLDVTVDATENFFGIARGRVRTYQISDDGRKKPETAKETTVARMCRFDDLLVLMGPAQGQDADTWRYVEIGLDAAGTPTGFGMRLHPKGEALGYCGDPERGYLGNVLRTTELGSIR